MPMYQVIINGLNITEVKRLFEAEPDIDTLKKELAKLNGKITEIANKTYRTKVSFQYFDANWMYAKINVGRRFAGSVPIVSLVYQSGTAIPNTINVSAEQVKTNGETLIWAYGSGFVSNHVLYAMIECMTK